MGDETLAAQPPVNEVVLSVAMSPQPMLVGPRVPEILGSWYEEHRNVQVVQPYVMPIEQAPDIGSGMPSGPSINFTNAVESRYWLHSVDGSEVIQVQPDYLALNWKRVTPDQIYPHFGELRQRFSTFLSNADSGLQRAGGAVLPIRAELTYINLIEPNPTWSNLSETHKVVNVSSGLSQDYEQFSFSASAPIIDAGEFLGRVHVSVQPAYNWAKAEARINLNITARSLNFTHPSSVKALSFFDKAHIVANDAFRSMITTEARAFWGV
ncbi:TIGR04255 family protein [Streptomyces sp. S1D4-23]|uniref:TIGR04255 family protein n=1 Tax=Streptomyces sp. S1D4-23 TaxID=2594463 RepID=UPI00099F3BDD|nr:TIGR04255 family protein [Streptomyces sp. S1D4-23]QDO08273.1 TIGR04255 family protein [Streptomyces sp. S1D4-23]